jgi:hypothetical protein
MVGTYRRYEPKSSGHPRLNDDDPVATKREHDPLAPADHPLDFRTPDALREHLRRAPLKQERVKNGHVQHAAALHSRP